MTNYRRAHTPGATWFFTVNIARRDTTVLVEHIALLRQALQRVRRKHPFSIDALVVLPDHLHAVWTLPPGDAGYAMRWRQIKGWFSRHAPAGEHRSASRIAKGERGIWQRRYWEHLIRDEDDLQRHVDYIHFNPVKHGHVARAVDWPYSTLHRYVAKGWLAEDWGGVAESAIEVGERG
ncbi:MAG TPA: transposase [Luteimonas sp.]